MLDVIPLLHYFKEKNEYSGAHFGMRYHFALKKEKRSGDDGSEVEVTLLCGTIWPEPWAKEYTDPALHIKKEFPFSDEGRKQAADWLREVYYSDEERWRVVPNILDSEPWKPQSEDTEAEE